MDNEGKIDPLLSDKQAAPILGCAPSSLKQAAYTGVLFGRPAPSFIKMGRSRRYKFSVLMAFRDQFPECRNTSDIEQLQL
jgi:hypothetical protein